MVPPADPRDRPWYNVEHGQRQLPEVSRASALAHKTQELVAEFYMKGVQATDVRINPRDWDIVCRCVDTVRWGGFDSLDRWMNLKVVRQGDMIPGWIGVAAADPSRPGRVVVLEERAV